MNLPIKAKSNLSSYLIGKQNNKICPILQCVTVLESIESIEQENIPPLIPILTQSIKGAKGELKKMSDSLLNAFMKTHGDQLDEFLPEDAKELIRN